MAKRTPTPMTIDAASRIYKATAKANNGMVPKDSFAANAMRHAHLHLNAQLVAASPKVKGK